VNRKLEYTDGFYKNYTGSSHIHESVEKSGMICLDGSVITPHGIVHVSSRKFAKGCAIKGYASLMFYQGEDEYVKMRTFDSFLLKLSLSRQAYKFAREVVGAEI